MTDADIEERPASLRGGRQSVIERFGINGLHGFRSISLASEFAATILIARNGTGKTTLLGALDAFLRRQFYRLRGLEFKEIYCKFRGEEEIALSHEDIEHFIEVPTEGELVKLSARIGIAPNALFTFLTDEWPTLRELPPSVHFEDTVFVEIVRSVDYSTPKAKDLCDRLLDDLLSRFPRMATVSGTISRVLRGFDIVYLPTYRRVELVLRREPNEGPRRKKRPKFDVAAGSLFTGDIQFGLSDISERLAEMNSRIVNESNTGYREISANIINEMIDGSFEREPDLNRKIPSPEELKLFFSRLEGSRRPFYPRVSVPNFDRLYSGDVSAYSGRFLNYFLNQLGKVIETTKDIERSVEDFVSSCNRYLLSEEVTTRLSDDMQTRQTIDGKELHLNRQNLSVHVESVPTHRRISLDALSSGEKQMISLFAKMFLYEGEKIVLIDEPELSLSIDWQREILVDVLKAPLCRQVVAITHSPFVFDNELEPFAKSLSLSDIA